MAAGMTQSQVAEKLKVTAQAVSQWEGDKTEPTLSNVLKMADLYNVEVANLHRGPGPDQPAESRRMRAVPLISKVQAGHWQEVISETLPPDTRWLEIEHKPIGSMFALELGGESMLPDFQSGDVIIVDTGVVPLPGDFVVATTSLEDEATFKRYRPRGLDEDGNPIIELVPSNPDYPTLLINSRHPGRIVGTMVEHRRFRRRHL